MINLGRYQQAFRDEARFNAVITDPPYGDRTHAGQSELRADIAYAHWTPSHVRELVAWAAARCNGWICSMTSDDLIPAYRDAYEAEGLYSFAPVPIIQPRPRLSGDGPASWTVYLMAARPRSRDFAGWGSLPGAYWSRCEQGAAVIGAKPLDLMRAIVRDYSRPGDVVCDPCAGGGTTLLAALWEGRQAIGAEVDPETHRRAHERLASAAIPVRPLFDNRPSQEDELPW